MQKKTVKKEETTGWQQILLLNKKVYQTGKNLVKENTMTQDN